MQKTLIIEIPYAALGDHLFHSHLPRIAKETGSYDKVYISLKSPFRHPETKHLVWDLNPFIDGFIDEHGTTCDIFKFSKQSQEINLLDKIMFHYGLDDGKRWHEPEIYYKPKFIEKYHCSIYDPNYISWVGEIDKWDIMAYFKKEKIKFDAIMKIRNNKALYIPQKEDKFIETLTLMDFCDLIYSSTRLYCLTTGTAPLAASMGKSVTVLFGKNHSDGNLVSRHNTYILVDKCPGNKILNLLKTSLEIIKKIIPKISLNSLVSLFFFFNL